MRPATLLPVVVGVLIGTAVLAGCGSSTPTSAHNSGPKLATISAGAITVSHGWVAATTTSGSGDSMPGMDMSSPSPGLGIADSVAYAELSNSGSTAQTLVSVTANVATAMLHQDVSTANGSAGTMTRLVSLTVPAHGHVQLQPGGDHVMLTKMTEELSPGDQVQMTWRFRSGLVVTGPFPVISREQRPQS